MQPVLSVVIPVSGSPGKYAHLLSWLEKFESRSVEIILIADNLPELDYKKLSDKVKNGKSWQLTLLRGKFGNPGESRNLGIDKSQGQWTAFWDCDDIPLIDEFLKMCLSGTEAGSDLCIGRFEVSDLKGSIKKSKPLTRRKLEEEITCNPGIWRMAFKRELIEGLRFPRYRMAEDQNFIQHVLLKGPNIYFSDEAVYRYFKGIPESLTSSNEGKTHLKYAVRDTSKLLMLYPGSKLLQQNLMKQIVTIFKNPKIRAEFLALRLISKFIALHPVIAISEMLPNAVKVLLHMKSEEK